MKKRMATILGVVVVSGMLTGCTGTPVVYNNCDCNCSSNTTGNNAAAEIVTESTAATEAVSESSAAAEAVTETEAAEVSDEAAN